MMTFVKKIEMSTIFFLFTYSATSIDKNPKLISPYSKCQN